MNHPPPSAPTKPRLARKLLAPLERFLNVEAASGTLLLAAAALALTWANSPWSALYDGLWHAPVPLSLTGLIPESSVHFWINDGLMTFFFLVVGLEIRREIHEGSLANARLAMLPVVAALGGVLVPAAIYLAFNHHTEFGRGWAVPTATDIAFAVGVLTLLGPRVPSSLRALLLALAIIDDIVAVLVIAFFYSSGVAVSGLLIAAAGVLGVFLLQRLGVRSAFAYGVPGCVLWVGLLHAHIHPTLAGVVLGLLTPVRASRANEPEPAGSPSPAERVESALHPWVAFGAMPLFALANAGVNFQNTAISGDISAIVAGVFFGLVLGKPLGIILITCIGTRLRVLTLPPAVNGWGIVLVGTLAGIGFTMSIFIAGLAFQTESTLAAAKLAVLLASACSGIIGLTVGRCALRVPNSRGLAEPRS